MKKGGVYLKFIGNLFIIIMIYVIPLITYLKTVKINRNSKLIKTLVAIVYVVTCIILPEMLTNILPFILIIFTLINWKNNEQFQGEYENYKFSLKNFKIGKAFKYVGITYGLTLMASYISYCILSILKIPMEQQDVVTMLNSYDLKNFIITIPFTVIFAPVVEEFTFRYILFSKGFRNGIDKKIPFFISATLVSLVFAGAHFSITAFALLFVISFYNCYLVEKKGFCYAVFTHMVINGVTTTALLINKMI